MPKAVAKYNFKDGLKHEFELLDSVDLYKDHRDLLTEPHRANFHHIIWFQSGTGTHLIDFKPIKILPNSLVFVAKNKVQRFDPIGDFKAKIILFTDAFFGLSETDARFLRDTILFNDLFDDTQVRLNKLDKVFSDYLNMIEEESKKINDHFQHHLLKNLLYNFLLLAERKRRNQGFTEVKKGADLDYTLLFKDLLNSNFRKVKQVSFYSRELNVTEKRLNMATSKTLGMTPKDLIDQRIILEAKRLLSHTHISIKEVGFELGFDEPTNFIKYFKKHCNSTPVEFREKYSV